MFFLGALGTAAWQNPAVRAMVSNGAGAYLQPSTNTVNTQASTGRNVQEPAAMTQTQQMCPTEGQFNSQFGVVADVVRTENCSFHWRGDPQTITPKQICPSGWICTVGMANWQGNRQTVVFVGDDSIAPAPIFAATWRLISLYPAGDAVSDSCTFLKKVQDEGRVSDPQWTVVAGNFTCR
jgi:hypothetical protein